MIDLEGEGVLIAVAAVLSFCVGAGFMHKYDVGQAAAAKLAEVGKAAIETERVEKVTEVADRAGAQGAAEDAKINQSIIAEVSRVVPKTVSCPGYVDAVRVLNNAAATGVPISGATGIVDGAAGEAASDPGRAEEVAGTVTANLAQCRADLGRFGQLQDWIEGVAR